MTGRYRFDCPECAIDFVVDAEVRTDILDNGCPICGARCSPSNFEAVESSDPQAQ